MAITPNFYAYAAKAMFDGDVTTGDTIKMALLNGSGTFNASHTDFADVSGNEISASAPNVGYTAGGVGLTDNSAVAQPLTASMTGSGSSRKMVLNFGRARWEGATFAFTNAVLYSDTSADKRLLMHLAFGSEQTVAGGDIQINIPSPLPNFDPVEP